MATITKVDPYGDAAFPFFEVPDEVEEVFERYEMSVNGWEKSLGTYTFELEGYTDGGGDMLHSLYIKEDEVGSTKAWWKAFNDMYEDFDPWHEAFVWCDEFGVPQRTPFSNGEDLFNDIKEYEKGTLGSIERELFDLTFRQ